MNPNTKVILFQLLCIGPFFWVVVLLYFALRFSEQARRIWFSWLMAKLLQPMLGSSLKPVKKELFAQLSTMTSSDPELRKQNRLRVLEVGIGTGANLAYFPDNIKLVAVDINKHFVNYFQQNKNKFPDLELDKFIIGSVEDMSEIPDNSVDAVVCTHVLCSVKKLDEAVKEIHRVLSPNGVFFFLEHIGDKKGQFKRRLQGFLEPYWEVLFAGCQLTVDTEKAIRSVGFREVNAHEAYIPDMPYPCNSHFIGKAIK